MSPNFSSKLTFGPMVLSLLGDVELTDLSDELRADRVAGTRCDHVRGSGQG